MSLNASIESLFPPNEMNLSNYKDGMQFEYFAKKNLDNSALPYVLRSNNPLGVHIMGGDKKWDGELDIQATAKNAEKEDVRLRALFKLADILDLEDKNQTRITQVSGALFQGFSPEQLEQAERPEITEGNKDG